MDAIRERHSIRSKHHPLWWGGMLCGTLAVFLWLASNRLARFGEFYAVKIYPIFVRLIGGLFSRFPFSAGELLLGASILSVLIYLIRTLRKLISSDSPIAFFRTLFCAFANLLSTAAILILIFMLGGGINYYRNSFAVSEGLTRTSITRQELEGFCEAMVEEANEMAVILSESRSSDSSEAYLLNKADLNSIEEEALTSMQNLGDAFSSLKGFYPNPKGVITSELMSLQQITGIYSPFTIEANYNTKIAPHELRFTICHELSHLKGFMREEEANFIAWLACYHSDAVDYRYSAALEGFIYAGNALYRYDKEKYSQIRSQLCEEAQNDLTLQSTYWHQYDGPIAETHDKINDTYLKANNQPKGVESYSECVTLMVQYYYDH